MGLFRKAVRRATPRPVRKIKRVVRDPVRTGVRAATPKPIRDVERAAFNVTHPINTAENALLKAATPAPHRSRAARPPAPPASPTPGRPPAPPAPPSPTPGRPVPARQTAPPEPATESAHDHAAPTPRPRTALLPVIAVLCVLAVAGVGLLVGHAGGANVKCGTPKRRCAWPTGRAASGLRPRLRKRLREGEAGLLQERVLRVVQGGVQQSPRPMSAPDDPTRVALISVVTTVAIIALGVGGFLVGRSLRPSQAEASAAYNRARAAAYAPAEVAAVTSGREAGAARGAANGAREGHRAGSNAGSQAGRAEGKHRAAAASSQASRSNTHECVEVGEGLCEIPGPGPNGTGHSCPAGSVPNADGGVVCVPESLIHERERESAPTPEETLPLSEPCPPGETRERTSPNSTMCVSPAPSAAPEPEGE